MGYVGSIAKTSQVELRSGRLEAPVPLAFKNANNQPRQGANPPNWVGQIGSPISSEASVVNPRFLSQFRVPGETRLAKLAPPIWLRQGGLAHS